MIATANLIRPMALAVAAVALAGVVSLGVTPALQLRQAAATEECDPQCWAILKYLTDLGLTPQQIEDLGNSGIPPTDTAPPVTTEPPTTTQPAAPVTTQPPIANQPPVTTQPPNNSPTCSTGAHCQNINDGIDQGWYPKHLHHGDPTDVADLRDVLEDFGAKNPHFDTQAALGALQDETGDADRFDMAKALANGLGITFADDDPSTPGDERMGAVQKLADLGIVFGYDGDSSTVSDQDFGGSNHMTNGQMASFLNRIKTPGGNSPNPGSPVPGSPYVPPVDPDEACKAGLPLTNAQRTAFAAQLQWRTNVDIKTASRPGAPWPPHPDVPGGHEFVVVYGSPVWPVVDASAVWKTVSEHGCVWTATEVVTRVSQMLPWRASHRAELEAADGFDAYLSRWDNQTAGERTLAPQRHADRDVDVRCAFAMAKVEASSKSGCHWELPHSDAWSWQAVACFKASTDDATYRECATLADGIEWFRTMDYYTRQIAMRDDVGASGGRRPLAPARSF